MGTIHRDGTARLLVSVRDAAEAVAALEGGAEIIDIKEPSRGALGMANVKVIAGVVAAVRGRVPVSAALGELREIAIPPSLPTGVCYAKVGLADAPRDWHKDMARLFDGLAGVVPVAVAYADCPAARSPALSDVLDWAIARRAGGLLIDTCHKDGRGLFDHAAIDQLASLADRAHEAGLFLALAGSLTETRLPHALRCGADILAVRGAACERNDRCSRVAATRVRVLADIIATHNAATATPAG